MTFSALPSVAMCGPAVVLSLSAGIVQRKAPEGERTNLEGTKLERPAPCTGDGYTGARATLSHAAVLMAIVVVVDPPVLGRLVVGAARRRDSEGGEQCDRTENARDVFAHGGLIVPSSRMVSHHR